MKRMAVLRTSSACRLLGGRCEACTQRPMLGSSRRRVRERGGSVRRREPRAGAVPQSSDQPCEIIRQGKQERNQICGRDRREVWTAPGLDLEERHAN